jgi:hypothetical protein
MQRFASEKVGDDPSFEVSDFDVLKPADAYVGVFDLAFSLFSTLDFGMSDEIAASLIGLLRPGGTLLVYVPDMLVLCVAVTQRTANPLVGHPRPASFRWAGERS